MHKKGGKIYKMTAIERSEKLTKAIVQGTHKILQQNSKNAATEQYERVLTIISIGQDLEIIGRKVADEYFKAARHMHVKAFHLIKSFQ
jgi:hypothetical protein